MATKTKSAKKPATKRNVWPMSGTGKGYRGGDPLPSTQFKPMGDEKAARSMVRLLEAEGKVATAEKRGKVWGVSRPQGLVIGAWKKNPTDKNIASKESPLHDLGYGSKYYKANGSWYRSLSFRAPGGPKTGDFGPWERVNVYDKIAIEKALKAGKLAMPNPASDAADMYGSFHGLTSEEDLTFFEDHHYHSNLAALGVLIELKVKTVNGDKTVISFDRGDDYRETMANPGHPSGLSWMDAIFPSRNYLKVKTFKDEYSAQKLLGKIESQGGAGRVDRVGRVPGRYQYEVWQLRNARPATKNPAVAQMSATQINAALDKLDAQSSKLTDEMISAGRGHERPSETFQLTDPLAVKMKDLYRKRMDLVNEIELRYGPGAPRRLPTRGFGPRKQQNPKKGPIAKAAGVVKSATDWVDSKLVGNPGDSKDPTTILCSNEKGTQLYFIGGDQALKLSDLDITGPEADKEKVHIGQVTNITYHTTKKFGAKPETFDYVHKFSEDSNGPLPQLVYDRLNERLSLVGGVYYIEKPMLGTSPGIED